MDEPNRGAARFGVLVPYTNTNLEPDFALLCPPGVSMHYARLGGYDQEAIPDEAQMGGLGEAPLDEPVRLIAGIKPDIVFYGCTSATLAHGIEFDQQLARQIRDLTGALTVTAAGAVVFALSHLGVTKIGFSSPYVASLNERAINFIENADIAVVNRADVVGELDNYGQGNLQPDEVFELGCRADHPDAAAVVLSCTDMRSVEVVARLEAHLGKPVVCSNQAMLFEATSKLKLPPPPYPCGRLFH
jgi:maleate cis-trans isomerase